MAETSFGATQYISPMEADLVFLKHTLTWANIIPALGNHGYNQKILFYSPAVTFPGTAIGGAATSFIMITHFTCLVHLQHTPNPALSQHKSFVHVHNDLEIGYASAWRQ